MLSTVDDYKMNKSHSGRTLIMKKIVKEQRSETVCAGILTVWYTGTSLVVLKSYCHFFVADCHSGLKIINIIASRTPDAFLRCKICLNYVCGQNWLKTPVSGQSCHNDWRILWLDQMWLPESFLSILILMVAIIFTMIWRLSCHYWTDGQTTSGNRQRYAFHANSEKITQAHCHIPLSPKPLVASVAMKCGLSNSKTACKMHQLATPITNWNSHKSLQLLSQRSLLHVWI